MKTQIIKSNGAAFEFLYHSTDRANIKVKLSTTADETPPIDARIETEHEYAFKPDGRRDYDVPPKTIAKLRLPDSVKSTLAAVGIEVDASELEAEFLALVQKNEEERKLKYQEARRKEYAVNKAHDLKALGEEAGLVVKMPTEEEYCQNSYDGVTVKFEKDRRTVALECRKDGKIRYSHYGESTRTFGKANNAIKFVVEELARLESASRRKEAEARKEQDAKDVLKALVLGLSGLRSTPDVDRLDNGYSTKVYVRPRNEKAGGIEVGVLAMNPKVCYVQNLVLPVGKLQKLIDLMNEEG